MARKQKLAAGGLTTKHWFGYMFGDFGGCMTFALMASIFSMYCTNVLGINPVIFILGSWAAFKFVWNITPEVRAKMAAAKAALVEAVEATEVPEAETVEAFATVETETENSNNE